MQPNRTTADKYSVSRTGSLALLSLLVFVTRIPWIFAGPGLDADAYRVLQVANIIRETGIYEVSRVPGYPLYEYLVALVNGSDNYLLTNGISAISTAAAAVFLALILRRSKVAEAELIAFSFSFVPVVFNNSVVTMDYMPSLAFVLAATYYVSANKIVTGGILLGLAAGFRFSSVFMLVPLCVLILDTNNTMKSVKNMVVLGVSSIGVMGLCFLPVFARYGTGFLTFHDIVAYPSIERFVTFGFSNVWGSFSIFGWIPLLLTWVFLVSTRRVAKLPPNGAKLLRSSIVALGIYGIAFLRLPLESAYLIPIVPFVFIVISLLLPRRLTLVVVVIFAASSFVDLRGFHVNFRGPAITEYQARLAANKRVKQTISVLPSIPDNAVIVAGWKLPQIRHELRLIGKYREPSWVYLIRDEKDLRRYQTLGRPVYYLSKIDAYQLLVEGIDIVKSGARQFPDEVE